MKGSLKGSIYLIRGEYILLDADLAELYGCTVRTIRMHTLRDAALFPKGSVRRLTRMEKEAVLAQNPSAKLGKRSDSITWVYTEEAALFMEELLRTAPSDARGKIRRAFARMRRYYRECEKEYLGG